MNKDARICKGCNKRKALFSRSVGKRKLKNRIKGYSRVRFDKHHDLCWECMRNLRNALLNH